MANITKSSEPSSYIDMGLFVLEANNTFVLYLAALFMLAYCLSLLVAYLHTRVNALVFPMTAPEPTASFTEYIILVKTSLKLGSSLDPRARVSLQLKGNFGDSPKLLLRKGKTIYFFLCRGSVNIFVYHSPIDLGDILEVEIDLFNDTPYEIPSVQWKPCFIRVLQPYARKFWGCPINKRLTTENSLSESFPCEVNRWDRNGLLKALCKFHCWLSMFHCPVRLGMYSTLVHVIMTYLIIACIFLCAIIAYETREAKDMYRYGLGYVMCVWFGELVLEALLRNTKSRFRIAKNSLFFGLVEPMESFYNLDNFALDYNWDKVIRPLIVRNNVILVAGSEHGSAFNVFSVPTPYSLSNLWGLLTKEEERETRLIVQIWNMCSLPLPASMKWMAIEASGRKEEVLIRQAMTHFKSPFCVFDTWMLDWPLAYAEEPFVAGLIISHIMSNDFLMLLQLENTRKCSHMAQLCVHQWHGLISCLFLYVILHKAEDNKLAYGRIKSFIYQTLGRFGKRSPREIKASWIKRSELRSQERTSASTMSDSQTSNPEFSNSDSASKADANVNTSSQLHGIGLGDEHSCGPCPELADSEESLVGSEVMLQDLLVFDENSTSNLNHPQKVEDVSSRFESGDGNTMLEEITVMAIQEEEDMIHKTKLSQHTDCNTNADKHSKDSEDEGQDEADDRDDEDNDDDDRSDAFENESSVSEEKATLPMALYEQHFLGPPHLTNYTPVHAEDNDYIRYNDEILAYCCDKKRCKLFCEIHQKIGDSALEILHHIIKDLTNFVRIPPNEFAVSKMWKRKKMVSRMISDMTKKANMYDDDMFEKDGMLQGVGYNCNVRLTAIYDDMKQLLDKVQRMEKPMAMNSGDSDNNSRQIKRCVFCAKKLQSQYSHSDSGCYDLKRLVRFLTKSTVYVAEKEMNYQLASRYTIQNYCAAMLSRAREEVLLEIEDPPLVMAAYVLQAMLYSLLTNLMPKETDFNDLTADELRQLGTRLQRIKARYTTSDEEKNRSREQKRRFEKLKHLTTELGSRWRLTPNTKSLITSSKLMAECLVEERLLGLSVYTGIISKEHEALLNGDKEKLLELESKANSAVLKIARKICEPMVVDILDDDQNIDVIFPQKIKELNYLVEKMSLAQYNAEPIFLATCCYYVADIANVKIAEFKSLMKYMNEYTPTRFDDNPIPKREHRFKFNGELKILDGYAHSDVCSPVLRWGKIAVYGEPPLAPEFLPPRYRKQGDGELIFDDSKPMTEDSKVIAALVGAKRGMENYSKSEEYDKEKHLLNHLARVQAYLLDQIADAAQCITQITALDSDYVSEFHQDHLFNVELFASRKLKLPIMYVFGIILLVLMVVTTVGLCGFVCQRGSVLFIDEVKDWALLCGLFLLFYAFVVQPLKCILYSILRVYVD